MYGIEAWVPNQQEIDKLLMFERKSHLWAVNVIRSDNLDCYYEKPKGLRSVGRPRRRWIDAVMVQMGVIQWEVELESERGKIGLLDTTTLPKKPDGFFWKKSVFSNTQ